MIANIAGAAGGEQGIGERMKRHIRIGMALELLIMGNEDAAKDDTIAVFQLMDIIPIAGTHIRKCGREFFVSHGNIPLQGEFDIIDRSFDEADGQSSPFRNRGVISEIVSAR